MRRKRFPGQARLSRQAARLVWLAEGLHASGSRLEDAYWESQLARLLVELLDDPDNDGVLHQVLDHLHGQNGSAYEFLADAIEAACESVAWEGSPRAGPAMDTTAGDALLIALPVLVASPYHIPCGPLNEDTRAALCAQLAGHVLARDARVVLADHLFSPDQLPQGYAQTRALAGELTRALASGSGVHIDTRHLPETGAFSADVRYALGAVGVVAGAPVWRWNEPDGNRDAAQQAWGEQGGELLRRLLPGCLVRVLAPNAYHASWRLAEREMRTFSISAAVHLLRHRAGGEVKLRATYAAFAEQRLEEYRIGFSVDDSTEVAHGVVWPLLGAEDESSDVPEQIEAALREAGVTPIQRLDETFALEYCEDCGAPLFPNPQGELAHMASSHDEAEDAPAPRPHLH